jgi:hypothetical protein
MPSYADSLSLRDARRVYFELNAFGDDGGYATRWVKIKLVGSLAVWLPNTQGRVFAVRYHDLHHVATGYDTTLVGEGEIGAWEVASGCRDLFAAWVLNLVAMWYGLLLSPRRVFRAFVRGRHTRNLYGSEFDDALLASSVGAVRARLGLTDAAPVATPRDCVAFAGWLTVAFAVYALQSAVVLAPFALLIWWLW